VREFVSLSSIFKREFVFVKPVSKSLC